MPMLETFTRALTDAAQDAGAALWDAARDVTMVGAAIVAIAFIARGVQSLQRARAASGEIGTNVTLYIFDIIVVTPLLGLALAAMGGWMQSADITLLHPDLWIQLPGWLIGFLVVFAGDFIGYWRHRLEHTPPLWPAHAIHHSDTAMTWTTIFRFHPINRLS